MTIRERDLRLDILRGIAIVLVLGRHLPEGYFPASGPVIDFLRKWFQIGWTGVDLFFVLSGFLVSSLLFREYQTFQRIHPGQFLIRRSLKIYPAFYAMIFLSVLILGSQVTAKQVLVEMIYLQNYLQTYSIWPHTWSLAIEEHFYLVLVLIIFGLSKKGGSDPFRLLPVLWGVMALTTLVFRFLRPYDDFTLLKFTHYRFDALFFGTILSYGFHFHREALARFVSRWRILMILGAIAGLMPVWQHQLGWEPFMTRFGFTAIYISFGCLLLVALQANPLMSPPPMACGERIFMAWKAVLFRLFVAYSRFKSNCPTPSQIREQSKWLMGCNWSVFTGKPSIGRDFLSTRRAPATFMER